MNLSREEILKVLTDLAETGRTSVRTEIPEDRAWTDDGRWHQPKSFHPAACGGCTSDETRWGKPR